MSTLKAFFAAVKSVISLGAATNANARKEIRDVVGELADELDRALSLADSYLAGARYSRDHAELVQYLGRARGALMDGFHEHHVCAGLYQLADRFRQVFDPTKLSVSMASYRTIPELIDHLKNGERAVSDDLQGMVDEMQDSAAALHAASPEDAEAVRKNALARIDTRRAELRARRTELTAMRRRVVDEM
jgi:hypothetical protein